METTLDNSFNNADFETVALPHLNDLYRTARRLIGNTTEAEDIVQETYLQAWKSFHRFQTGTNIRAWLFKILFHVTAHHRRKLFRLPQADVTDEMLAETVAFQPSPSQELRDQELLKALQKVPQFYRAVLLLADVQEFSYKEISDILNIPLGTVMSRLSRGRKSLREALPKTSPAIRFNPTRQAALAY